MEVADVEQISSKAPQAAVVELELDAGDTGVEVVAATAKEQAAAPSAASVVASALKRKRSTQSQASGKKKRASGSGAAVVDIESDSGSSSSSSSGIERRNKRVGAAAATALLTSQKPLDIEEAEQLHTRELEFPTSFAARFHHEGGLVAIMVESGTDINLRPSISDQEKSVLHITGTDHGVGRAASQIQLAFETHVAAQELAADDGKEDHLVQLEVPSSQAGRLMKNGGALIAKVRESHSGVMIAVQPPTEPGGPALAVIGPGRLPAVKKASAALKVKLEAPEEVVAPEKPKPKSPEIQKDEEPGPEESFNDAGDYECVD
mmetsp:Transcript_27339/g.63745  ORF Transcript_27339/g.63745 Transcript_27339/m.63745 type:complete len:320 (+) Transcript_27339:98-1057(+)